MTEYEKTAMDFLKTVVETKVKFTAAAEEMAFLERAIQAKTYAAEIMLRYEGQRVVREGVITFENRTKESEG